MTDEALSRTVHDLEERRLRAMLDGDHVTLAALLDDALIYIHSTALKDSKASYLRMIESGTLVYHCFDPLESATLPVSDDLIMLSGRMRMHIDWHGAAKIADSVYIATWVKRPEKDWQLLSWQSTAAPPPAV